MKRPRKQLLSVPPGQMIAHADSVVATRLDVMRYDADLFTETSVSDLSELGPRETWEGVCWINVNGLGNISYLESLKAILGLHPLALEDALHLSARPKVEDYSTHLFFLLKMLTYQGTLECEQLSIFLSGNVVVTLQEHEGDCLDALRERIRRGTGQIRHMGADYLAYAVVDAVVDSYFPVLEAIGDEVETLEDVVAVRADAVILKRIHGIKRSLLTMRRATWPLREATSSMSRDGSSQLSETVQVYLRDCHDHAVQVIDLLETYRELAGGLMDIYLSTTSNRMNEVMKVLTIIATIFIPLTFMAGVYGMNFEHMPELSWRYSYPVLWVAMIAVAGAMIAYFRRKGWLGSEMYAASPTAEEFPLDPQEPAIENTP